MRAELAAARLSICEDLRGNRDLMDATSREQASFRAEDCLIGCVAENNDKFLGQAVRFAKSLRWFGEELATARLRVCVVGDVPSHYRQILESLGAEVRVVTRFHARNPFANKLQFFNQSSWDEAELFLLLDCDTAIVQNPLPLLRRGVFQAKIADLPTVSHEAFVRVFERYGLTLPAREYTTDFQPTATIPYFNSGALFLPCEIARELIPVWRAVNQRLADEQEILGPHAHHCNQAALAIALVQSGVPVRAVGRELNYPLHLTHLPTPVGFHDSDPAILHYHERVDAQGLLLPSPYPLAQARIAAFNERLETGAQFCTQPNEVRPAAKPRFIDWIPRLWRRARGIAASPTTVSNR